MHKKNIIFENNDLKIEIFRKKDLYLMNIILNKGMISPEVLKQLSIKTIIKHRSLKDKGIILNGKLPVWLYSRLIALLKNKNPLFLAVNDPSKPGAIIVDSNSRKFEVGEKIDKDIFIYLIENQTIPDKGEDNNKRKNKIIALAGPPHSGKTVLLQAICKAIAEKDLNYFQKNVFIIRACPDGEGDWFLRNFNESNKYRIKLPFDDEFVKNVIERIDNTSKNKEIVFVDCGGKIDHKNYKIWEHCSHCIIVSNNESETQKWIDAVNEANLKIIAVVKSETYDIYKEEIKDDGTLFIKIGKLERNKANEIKLEKSCIIDKILYL